MNGHTSNVDLLFRKKLKEIWDKIQIIVVSNRNLASNGSYLQELALDFYNTFVNTPIPVIKHEYHFENYYSVIIPLENSCLSIPYKFYELTKIDPVPDLNPIFDIDVNWRVFLTYFYEKIFTIRIPLVESDIKILKVMTQFAFSMHKKHLPYTVEEIAKRTEHIGKKSYEPITKVTVARRLNYLRDQNILTEYYLINSWAVGYKIFLFVYQKTQDESIHEWDKWTIFKQYLMDNNIFRVVRIPQHAEGELVFPESIQKVEIKRILISNNVSKLDMDKNKSFSTIPVFEAPKLSNYQYIDLTEEEDNNWIQSLYNMTYSDDASQQTDYEPILRLNKDNRINVAFKFLCFIAREGIISYPIERTAKRAGIDRNLFDSYFKFFIDMKVLFYCTRTAYIGCNVRMGIMLYSLEQTVQEHPVLQNFLTNLCELPYAYVFISDYAIAAYINLPNAWVGSFMSYLSILTINQDLLIYFGQHIALQSYVKFNLPFTEEEVFSNLGIRYKPIVLH